MVNIGDIVTVLIGGLTGGGLVKALEWWLTKDSKAKEAESSAELAEVKTNLEEFHYLKERIEVAENHNKQLDEILLGERTRYHEQTLLVRKLNEDLLNRADEIAELKSEISELRAERAMKLCEQKGCQQRQPQSGY